ncbi:hypothetical protein HGH93_06485 [Chitinophaga polysaccharea]|uniref:hypothetical protein n=1 Tax=Chitinophaga TaxID=79328 RepID=UPI001455D75B|nr:MULTISPECIES: hypothetical protein [Chitinophaga]NLR57737.1 hypothetical protein [Chitinophaga polysaccharea]NLU93331.1 hypothetical protein [Chitinophaga sp. Ak27]
MVQQPTLLLDNVKILAADGSSNVKSGRDTCTVFYDAVVTTPEQNPVQVVSFVLSDLKVAIDPASWQKTMLISEDFLTYTQIVDIHSDVQSADPIEIRVSLTIQDRLNNRREQITSFTLIP